MSRRTRPVTAAAMVGGGLVYWGLVAAAKREAAATAAARAAAGPAPLPALAARVLDASPRSVSLRRMAAALVVGAVLAVVAPMLPVVGLHSPPAECPPVVGDGSGAVEEFSGPVEEFSGPRADEGNRHCGLRIVFASDRDGTSGSDIYLLDEDGDVTRLTFDSGQGIQNRDPAPSPDGTAIAFTSIGGDSPSIMLMDVDGSNQRFLAEGQMPAWSPDGNFIAFNGFDPETETNGIMVMDRAGGRVRLIPNTRGGQSPSWSPNGEQIVFTRFVFSVFGDRATGREAAVSADGNGFEAIIINLDGTGERTLPDPDGQSEEPAWSPLGREIAVAASRSDRDCKPSIAVTAADGSTSPADVVDDSVLPCENRSPSWSADGSEMVFSNSGDQGTDGDLYVVNRDGTDLIQITDNGGVNDTEPAFFPRLNRPPLVIKDSFVAFTATPRTFNVLANDSDPDSDPISVVDHSDARNGTVECAPEGNCTYTSEPGFDGFDEFTYTAADSRTAASTTTVGVRVEPPPNLAPTAEPDTLSTQAGSPGTVNVMANDSDPEGQPLTLTSNSQGANGTVSCTAGGVCTYTPRSGFNGTDQFTYTISDGTNTADAVVTVAVTDENGPPTAVDDVLVLTGGTGSVEVLANDFDPDGDALTVTANSEGANGSVACLAGGRCTYTSGAGFEDVDQFTYTVSDGSRSATAVVRVTLVDVPTAPPQAADDRLVVPAGTVGTVEVMNNDFDPNGDLITLANSSQGADGVVTCAPGGRCTYTSRSSFTGSDAFTYSITDNRGGTATGRVFVTVTSPRPVIGTEVLSGTLTSPAPRPQPQRRSTSRAERAEIPPAAPDVVPEPPATDVIREAVVELPLTLDRPSTVPGGEAVAAGEGCAPGSDVVVSTGDSEVTTVVADQAGRFEAPLPLPELAVGRHEVVARCGGTTLRSTIDVVIATAASGGSSSVGAILAFFVLLILLVFRPPKKEEGQRGAGYVDSEDEGVARWLRWR